MKKLRSQALHEWPSITSTLALLYQSSEKEIIKLDTFSFLKILSPKKNWLCKEELILAGREKKAQIKYESSALQ